MTARKTPTVYRVRHTRDWWQTTAVKYYVSLGAVERFAAKSGVVIVSVDVIEGHWVQVDLDNGEEF